MNTIKTISVLMIVLLSACSKKSSCDVDNPLIELSWLSSKVDNYKMDNLKQSILLYEYEGDEVYLIDDCLDICSDALTIVYDCEGNIVCEFGGIDGRNTCPDFEEKATFKETLYLEE